MNDARAKISWQGPILAALLFAFALVAVGRLNPFCLLEPDTPDYLFTSRALARFEGYREIDNPDEPLHTFRPPGLPALLAPLSLLRPYDVVAAKLVVVGTALALLILVWTLARWTAGSTAAVVTTALVATSPYTLLHATEVVTEVPFVVAVLGLLLLAAGCDGPPGRLRLTSGCLLLALLPLLRTIGVALVAAFVVWALLDRDRRRWLVAPALSVAVAVAWSVRNAAAGGPTYVESIAHDLRRAGAGSFALEALESAWVYTRQLVEVLLPGVERSRPLYERVLLNPAADLGGMWGLALPATLVLCGLAFWGMLRRRDREGLLVLSYVVLFVAGLAVYPPKHERLLWPLIALIWIYVPAGAIGLRALVARDRRRIGWAMTSVGLALTASFAVWQLAACGALVRVNLSWLQGGDRFYEEQAPPFYYCDWQSAGDWIRANTPVDAIVLTRHSDVGFTARRYQDSARLEELAPSQWRARLAALHARYMVVPTTMFGLLFDWPALAGDPVYRYEPVYRARGVMVLEVRPNREGTVSAYRPEPFEDIDACRAAAERYPDRLDFQRRLAELLGERDRQDEAIRRLEELVDRGVNDAGVFKSLGALLLDLDRPAQALERFRQASDAPGAELLARSIERGRRRAQSEARRGSRSPADEARELLDAARWEMEILRFDEARRDASRALELMPGDPSAAFVLAEVLHRFGRDAEALAGFRRAASAGLPGAAQKVAMLELAQRLDGEPGAPDADSVARLAAMYAEDAMPGKALVLLEGFVAAGGAPVLHRTLLAELYLYYGDAEAAEPLYEEVLREAPGDERAQRGLLTARRLLRVPSY